MLRYLSRYKAPLPQCYTNDILIIKFIYLLAVSKLNYDNLHIKKNNNHLFYLLIAV
jgi:hypothetical protein